MRGFLYHGSRVIAAQVRSQRRPLLVVLAMIGILVALASVSTCRAQTIANTLAQVNAKRAQLGLYALLPDPRLQAAAEYDAAWRAHLGATDHLRWTPMPGSNEGIGYGGSHDPWGTQFHSCYHTYARGRPPYTRSHRYAGAATATARGMTHHTLILR